MKINGVAIQDKNFVNNAQLSFYTVETVTIDLGSCSDVDNAALINITSSINVAITGSGANGLDTGTEANNTWYAVFVISGTNGVAGLLSTSDSSPTMPSGFTFRRRLGWVYNHSDGNLQDFKMTGKGRKRTTWWNETPANYTKVLDNGVSNGSWAEVSVTSVVPTTAEEMYVRGSNSAGAASVARLKPGDYLPLETSTASTYMMIGEDEVRYNIVWMDCGTNKSFRYYSDSGTPRTTVSIWAWRETL